MPDDGEPPTPQAEAEPPAHDLASRESNAPSQPGGARSALTATARFVSSHALFFLASAVGGSLVVLLTLISSEVYEAVKNAEGLAALDKPALASAIGLRTPADVAAVHFFTNLGGTLPMTVITIGIVTIMTFVWRSRTPIVVIAVGAAGSLLMTVVGKDLVGRARPPQMDAIAPYETSPSFPSGHTLNSTVIASLVAYLIALHLTSILARILTVVAAVVWFVAMGLSRVFLGYHWLTDVIVGWTLGLAWVAIVIGAHQLFLTVRGHRRQRAVLA